MVVDNLPLVQTPPRKNRAPVRPYAVSMLASALAIVANPALAQDVEPTGDDPSELPVPVPPAGSPSTPPPVRHKSSGSPHRRRAASHRAVDLPLW